MNYSVPLVIIATLFINGCAFNSSSSDDGEYLELLSINVIERNLSAFSPTVITKTNNAFIATKKSPQVLDFTVRSGERYQAALKRWLTLSGYHKVAWSLNAQNQALLDETNAKAFTYNGSLKNAIGLLSERLGVSLHIVHDKSAQVVGVYDFQGEARITHVKGDSLKVVVERLVKNYGFRWDSGDGFSRSWLSPDNYEFGADYYLLTAKDDIETALTIVLEDYPVYSAIVESTGQVIIQEDL